MRFQTKDKYKILVLLKATIDYKKILMETIKTISTAPDNIGAISLLNGKINLCVDIINSLNRELTKGN